MKETGTDCLSARSPVCMMSVNAHSRQYQAMVHPMVESEKTTQIRAKKCTHTCMRERCFAEMLLT